MGSSGAFLAPLLPLILAAAPTLILFWLGPVLGPARCRCLGSRRGKASLAGQGSLSFSMGISHSGRESSCLPHFSCTSFRVYGLFLYLLVSIFFINSDDFPSVNLLQHSLIASKS